MRLSSTLSLLLLFAHSVLASSWYVSTNGNDGNSGVDWSNAWRNVYYAAAGGAGGTDVQAGDTVYIGNGEYSSVTNTVSGSIGSPITFVGQRSGTNWLTLISGGTLFDSGWTSAPWGSNTYQRDVGFITRELTIDHKRVMGIFTTLGLTNASGDQLMSGVYTTPYPATNGVDFFSFASNKTVTLNGDNGGVINFWDAIGALWTRSNTFTYLRMADGSDPNGLNIRCAPNNDSLPTTVEVFRGAIQMPNVHSIVWSNVAVADGFSGYWIYASGASARTNTYDITIISNRITGGYAGIEMWRSPYLCNIVGNHLMGNFYGTDDTGAWIGGENSASPETYRYRQHHYSLSKYAMTIDRTTFENRIRMDAAGNTNTICYNLMHGSLGQGINLANDETTYGGIPDGYTHWTMIFSNTFEAMPSVGVTPSKRQVDTRIFRNSFSDCDVQVRFQALDNSYFSSETQRSTYVYRNTSYLPINVGNHVFYYVETNNFIWPLLPMFPTVYVYNNSFSGGEAGIEDNSHGHYIGGHTNGLVVNNVFDHIRNFLLDYTAQRQTNMWFYDYNLVTNGITYGAPATDRVYFGTNNISINSNQWVNSEGMSFELTADSQARDSAIDVSAPFSIRGRTFSALPDTATKVGAAWDIGAVEYSAPPIVITNRVQYTEDLWIK